MRKLIALISLLFLCTTVFAEDFKIVGEVSETEPKSPGFMSMIDYKGKIYAGTYRRGETALVDVYSYSYSAAIPQWRHVSTITPGESIYAFEAFDNRLYAITESNGELYRSEEDSEGNITGFDKILTATNNLGLALISFNDRIFATFTMYSDNPIDGPTLFSCNSSSGEFEKKFWPIQNQKEWSVYDFWKFDEKLYTSALRGIAKDDIDSNPKLIWTTHRYSTSDGDGWGKEDPPEGVPGAIDYLAEKDGAIYGLRHDDTVKEIDKIRIKTASRTIIKMYKDSNGNIVEQDIYGPTTKPLQRMVFFNSDLYVLSRPCWKGGCVGSDTYATLYRYDEYGNQLIKVPGSEIIDEEEGHSLLATETNLYIATKDHFALDGKVYEMTPKIFLPSMLYSPPMQNVAPPELAVTPVSYEVDHSAGSVSAAIENVGGGTMPWTAAVISGADWLSITSGHSGTGNGAVTLGFSANPSDSSRTGTVRITANGANASPQDVTVIQSGIAATVATPGISPNGGTFTSQPTITLSCTTPNATIRYTTDGSTPVSNSTEYTAPFAFTSNEFTLNARGFRDGYTESDVASADFIIAQTQTPALSVTPSLRDVGREAATTSFSVDNVGAGSMPWTASVVSGASWLSITSGASGNNAGTIAAAFFENTTDASRTGTIRITATDAVGSPIDITVSQSSDYTDTDGDGINDTDDTDDDNDGISDEIENAHPNNGDGNSDTILDSLQNNVTSIRSHGGDDFITLESSVGTSLSDCRADDNPDTNSAPENIEFPYGFIDFTINGVVAEQNTTLTLYFPVGQTLESYYKYGPTPENQTDHWYEFLYDGSTGAEVNDNIITLHFIDADRGDDILTQDSMIVDVGGPAVLTNNPTTGTGSGKGGGGGGGGCFVTASQN